jgi:hypothetical protein
MRIFFACLFLTVVSGCALSHGLDGIEPPPVPMGDAGPMPIDDAGEMPEPDSGSTVPDSGPVVMADAGSDAGSALVAGEPIVVLHDIGLPDELTVGTHRVRFQVRSSGAPIGVKRIEIGVPVHPYNEDAGREAWNWSERFQIVWDAVTVERDGIVADDIRVLHWTFVHTPFRHSIVLVFQDEEIVDEGGHEYVVNVPIAGDLMPGDRVGFDVNTLGDGVGNLTPDDTRFSNPYRWPGPHIYTADGACDPLMLADDPSVVKGLFVWSDRTAPDHNDDDCTSGGSADWRSGTATQMGGGYDLVVPTPVGCEAVDVPADGFGRVIVRVEGGGDMTVPPETDFVAFSVIIENRMPTSVSAETHTHAWTLSADCTVAGPTAALTNECDATNRFHPTAGSCGGGACGYSCAEVGPMFASGTSTRFTAYARTRASGIFGLELTDFVGSSTWITFRDESGVILSTDMVDGDESDLHPLATITVP